MDAAALRANERWHVMYDNSLHVEELTNIVIDELLDETSFAAHGATDLGRFA